MCWQLLLTRYTEPNMCLKCRRTLPLWSQAVSSGCFDENGSPYKLPGSWQWCMVCTGCKDVMLRDGFPGLLGKMFMKQST
jgi:hypothetical protein